MNDLAIVLLELGSWLFLIVPSRLTSASRGLVMFYHFLKSLPWGGGTRSKTTTSSSLLLVSSIKILLLTEAKRPKRIREVTQETGPSSRYYDYFNLLECMDSRRRRSRCVYRP
jgi:hypothetical protein